MKLSKTLILLVMIPIVIFTITYEITVYSVVKDQIVELTLSEATSLVNLVSKEIRNPVYFLDVDETNNIIKNLQLHPEIESVYVLFPDGRIFTDGTKENQMFGKFSKDEFLQKSTISNDLIFKIEGKLLRIIAPVIIDETIGYVQIDYALYELDSLVEKFSSMLLIISIIMAIVAGIIGYLISLYVLSPITKLQNFSKKISENDFDLPDISGPDEIRHLAEDLTMMAKKLEDSRTQLANSERLSSIGKLSARIEHDLRNPLNVLSMALDMIDKQQHSDLDEKTKKYLPIMKNSIYRMTRQINGVLGFVQNRNMQIESIKILKLLGKALETIQIPKNIEIILPQNNIEISVDSEQFQIVFINIIFNAIQAIGDNRGRIFIRTSESEKDVVIEFEDSGPGISSKNISRIFEPLFTTKHTGTGLGLVSCKTIIEQHGGKISVTSPPTIFTITLPKTKD